MSVVVRFHKCLESCNEALRFLEILLSNRARTGIEVAAHESNNATLSNIIPPQLQDLLATVIATI